MVPRQCPSALTLELGQVPIRQWCFWGRAWPINLGDQDRKGSPCGQADRRGECGARPQNGSPGEEITPGEHLRKMCSQTLGRRGRHVLGIIGREELRETQGLQRWSQKGVLPRALGVTEGSEAMVSERT